MHSSKAHVFCSQSYFPHLLNVFFSYCIFAFSGIDLDLLAQASSLDFILLNNFCKL